MTVIITPNRNGDYVINSKHDIICTDIGLNYVSVGHRFNVVDEKLFFLSVIKYDIKFEIVEESEKNF